MVALKKQRLPEIRNISTIYSRPFAECCFVWKPEYKESLELNPVLRLRFRLPPRPDMMKVLVPAHLVDGNVRLQQGNHELIRDEEVLPAQRLTSLGLCHFPIRNLLQYASKVVVGYLQYSAMPDWDHKYGSGAKLQSMKQNF